MHILIAGTPVYTESRPEFTDRSPQAKHKNAQIKTCRFGVHHFLSGCVCIGNMSLIRAAGIEAIFSLGKSAKNHPCMLQLFGRHLNLPISGIDAAYPTPEIDPAKAGPV